MRLPLVISFALLLGVTPAFAGDFSERVSEGAGPSQPAQPAEAPPVQSPTPNDDSLAGARPCHFGPFIMRIDGIEAARIAQAAPSGREALEKILALEENPDLPPFTFSVATEDDGGEDITCPD